MPDKKYQIFISSTFADLKEERKAAMQSVIDLRHIPIGMEGFPAVDEEQLSYIRRLIDECDYYVLIMKNRYGSTDDSGSSFTELEYDYAVSKGKHVLAFLNNGESLDDCDNPAGLTAFRAKVSKGRLIKHWADIASLELAVFKSLSAAFESDPRVGWVRGDTVTDPKVLEELHEARQRIAELTEQVTLETKSLGVENLAGLDATITVPYTYWTADGTGRASFQTKLGELFVKIAPEFRALAPASAMNAPVREWLEQRGVRNTLDFGITTDHQDILLNQLELLGLLSDHIGGGGSGRAAVRYLLTPDGERLMRTSLALKTE